MAEWKESVLGDILEVRYGKDHKKLQNGLVPCYGTGGIMRYVDDELYSEESILIPRKGSLNNIYYVDEPFWTVDTLFWTYINKVKAFPKFLFYQLKLIDFTILNVGSAVPSLTVPVLNGIDVVLPPLPEQKDIAEVLSSLDDKIDLLQRQNKTLEQMGEAIFRQWFVEEAKDDWAEGVVSDLIDFNPRRILVKGTIAPYLEMASLNTQTFHPDGWYDREYKSGTKFINEDTLLARITPCLENGKTAYVTFLQDKQVAWGSTEYIIMRPKEGIHPFFAYTLARNGDFRDYAEGCLVGSSGRQRIDLEHLKNFYMPIPPKHILENFNKILEELVPKLNVNALQISTLEKLRNTLLPKLMSGEVWISSNG